MSTVPDHDEEFITDPVEETTEVTDDVVSDDEHGDSSQAKIHQLKEKLKQCEKEKQEYLDGWQRSRADYLNLQREEESRRGEIKKYAQIELLEELLPVADNFELAFANQAAWQALPANWREGIEHIYRGLQGIFRQYGLEEIAPGAGEPFDPLHHHSIGTVMIADETGEGTIQEVAKKGYILNGKILRPAQVKTASWKPPEKST